MASSASRPGLRLLQWVISIFRGGQPAAGSLRRHRSEPARKPGNTWRLNLYRIGGKVNPQYSPWSNTGTPQPTYHAPERFGIVRCSGDTVDVSSVAAPPAE